MDNATAALQFRLDPCPVCGERITVDNVVQIGESWWALLHNCPKAPGETFIQCTGENVRMTVQNWNKAIRRYTNAKG